MRHKVRRNKADPSTSFTRDYGPDAGGWTLNAQFIPKRRPCPLTSVRMLGHRRQVPTPWRVGALHWNLSPAYFSGAALDPWAQSRAVLLWRGRRRVPAQIDMLSSTHNPTISTVSPDLYWRLRGPQRYCRGQVLGCPRSASLSDAGPPCRPVTAIPDFVKIGRGGGMRQGKVLAGLSTPLALLSFSSLT